MARKPRQESAASIYHIVARGSSHQIVLETDEDRAFFMKRLSELLGNTEGELLAWCLMDNHVHLLIKLPMAELSALLRMLLSGYASYFNRVHGRTGPLFEGRFSSEPVDTDEYLITVVKYIHRNPVKAGLPCGFMHQWSSYREYLGSRRWVQAEFVLGVFGGVEAFRKAHEAQDEDSACLDVVSEKRRLLSDVDALRIANEILGVGQVSTLRSISKRDRDMALAQLKEAGLSARQIQRLTGVSLGAISNAGRS